MNCRFLWCVTDHGTPGWENAHQTERVVIRDLTLVGVYIEGGAEPEGMVRIDFPHLVLEWRPAVAEGVADLLDRIDGAHAAQVATAVRTAAASLLQIGGQL